MPNKKIVDINYKYSAFKEIIKRVVKMSYFCDDKNCICQDYFNFDFTEYFIKEVVSLINHNYFRAQLINTDKVPERGERPRIFFSNHSGMSFPWDAIVFNTLFWEHNKFDRKKFSRPLVVPTLSSTKVMTPFMIDNLWKRAGGVDATLENFDILLNHGWDILIYPEGVPGIGKGFDRRYQIQRFSTSFLRMAKKHNAQLIPIYTINAEYSHPYSYKNDTLNKIVNKLGIPFAPLSPLTLLITIFPFVFYFSLPAKFHFVFGDPIEPDELLGDTPFEKLKRKDFIKARDTIWKDFQEKIDKYVEEYGQDPFHFEELFDILQKNPEKTIYILPIGWSVAMHKAVKSFYSGNPYHFKFTPEEFYQLAIENLDGLSFSLPLGWPLVLFFKGLIPEIIESIKENIIFASKMGT